MRSRAPSLFALALFGLAPAFGQEPPAAAGAASPLSPPVEPGASIPVEPEPPPPTGLAVEAAGAPMYATRAIIENLSAARDLTRFLSEIRAAGLVETLAGPGPYTVFAPVDHAFQSLPKSVAENLAKPEAASLFSAIAAYHVVAGRYSAADLIRAIRAAGGAVSLKTLEGELLIVRHDGRRLEILDARGRRAMVVTSDVGQKNGVIHVIDAVLLPKS